MAQLNEDHKANLAENIAAKPREVMDEKIYSDAAAGLRNADDDAYEVVALSSHYQTRVCVAHFYFGRHEATKKQARILAEELAASINAP